MKFILYLSIFILSVALSKSKDDTNLSDKIFSVFYSNYEPERKRSRNEEEDDTDDLTTAPAEEATEHQHQKVQFEEKHERAKKQSIPRKTWQPEAENGDSADDNESNKINSEKIIVRFNKNEYNDDVARAHNKSQMIHHLKEDRARFSEEDIRMKNMQREAQLTTDRGAYRIDPVLNMIETEGKMKTIRRRVAGKADDDNSTSSELSSSSSREMKDFKEEFREHWMHKKFEALNQSYPRGDQVNMIAARPWGVSCGDPNQHDMPWGTCMLAMECEGEYRIYRGDLYCGRTQFVCCALQMTNYDMYQGFDVSFDDSGLSTDSAEKKHNDKNSKEKKKSKKAKERKKRRKRRDERKKKIKKQIKQTIKEIKKILNKQYRNGTKQRKKRTKQLKKFIKELKKQYKKDRLAVQDIHEYDMIKIDNALLQRIYEIRWMNEDFAKNETFRLIITSGYMTDQGAAMLVEAYPELKVLVKNNLRHRHALRRAYPRMRPRAKRARRRGPNGKLLYDITDRKDELVYDIIDRNDKLPYDIKDRNDKLPYDITDRNNKLAYDITDRSDKLADDNTDRNDKRGDIEYGFLYY